MKYSIRINKLGTSFEINYPLLEFDDQYWMLQELNRCYPDYILSDVLPSIEKVRNGELVQDSTRQDICLIDTYEFGYDATIIDFGKEKSIISYGYGEGTIEVASEEIYTLMQEWGKYLREWKNSKTSL